MIYAEKRPDLTSTYLVWAPDNSALIVKALVGAFFPQ